MRWNDETARACAASPSIPALRAVQSGGIPGRPRLPACVVRLQLTVLLYVAVRYALLH